MPPVSSYPCMKRAFVSTQAAGNVYHPLAIHWTQFYQLKSYQKLITIPKVMWCATSENQLSTHFSFTFPQNNYTLCNISTTVYIKKYVHIRTEHALNKGWAELANRQQLSIICVALLRTHYFANHQLRQPEQLHSRSNVGHVEEHLVWYLR
jgi:hypothetical protein